MALMLVRLWFQFFANEEEQKIKKYFNLLLPFIWAFLIEVDAI